MTNYLLNFRAIGFRIVICLIPATAPLFSPGQKAASNNSYLLEEITTVEPLTEIIVAGAPGKTLLVLDGGGNAYVRKPLKPKQSFRVGGQLGKHSVYAIDASGDSLLLGSFMVNAVTEINDGGYYKQMFDLFHQGMLADQPDGTYEITWNGKTYHVFVPWVLDNFHTMKGMKYFKPDGHDLADIMQKAQRSDGMIWSFIEHMPNMDYWLTRDKYSGYSRRIGDRVFVRQPTENHPEYIYVNTIYASWKESGDAAWMKDKLASAARALDYAPDDAARWSKRFGLLKRVYTIDSWDFAVEDEYLPDIGITNTMIVDPEKSKFGVFFGDNTGYFRACYQLAEMYTAAGDKDAAAKYRQRGDEIRKRLNDLAWNGHFYTHFIDEDSTVVRHLGVDEKSQIAQSNAYSLNRRLDTAQCRAIIETYLNLKDHLPEGSPGEWYAIYPPFQKGFTRHDAVWQYMNGGVGGHVAGELAKGAYSHGYEKYGTDILNRLFELGKKYGNKIWFAYTGSIPASPPPEPRFKTLDLAGVANMDYRGRENTGAARWMMGTKDGDDFGNLPPGNQQWNGISFHITDPVKNNGRSIVAVSNRQGLPSSVNIPVHDTAASIYLLHTASKPQSEEVAGLVQFRYADGSTHTQYMIMGKHLAYWWFSQLKNDYAGIAWYGKNKVSEGIGLSWCTIDNPFPEKTIEEITVSAPADNRTIYTVFAVSLSSRPHYVPVKPTSFGGPDNWAAATAMAALVEGLAGVREADGSEGFETPVLSPRWNTTTSDSAAVIIRYAGYPGYVAYRYRFDSAQKQIRLLATGKGKEIRFHLELPEGISRVRRVTLNGKQASYQLSVAGTTKYVDAQTDGAGPAELIIEY